MGIKVTHVPKNEVSQLDQILREFTEEVKAAGSNFIRKGGRLDYSDKFDSLLIARKKLWEVTRDGMTKRQDNEIDIGLWAALVWFSRKRLQEKYLAEEVALDDLDCDLISEREAWDKLKTVKPEQVINDGGDGEERA